MLIVGVTGGIGSGKSTVCQVFELLGIPVFYADIVARDIMNTDQQLRKDLVSTFGPGTFSDDGLLNRKYIGDLVFNDQRALETLNALVHPAVFRAFENWLMKQAEAPYVLKEAALLFESESYKMCTHSLLIEAPDHIKISRVMQRNGITEAEVRLRMARQLSDSEKEKLADYLIYNDERQLLIPQVLKLHEQFIAIRPLPA